MKGKIMSDEKKEKNGKEYIVEKNGQKMRFVIPAPKVQKPTLTVNEENNESQKEK